MILCSCCSMIKKPLGDHCFTVTIQCNNGRIKTSADVGSVKDKK